MKYFHQAPFFLKSNALQIQTQTQTQQGVVLPIVLMMVLLLTVVSVAGMKNAAFEERMSGSIKRFSDAAQAADYMLGVCERSVGSGILPNRTAMATKKYLPQGPIPDNLPPFTSGRQWWEEPAAWDVAQGVTVFDTNIQTDVPQFEMNCLVEVVDIPPDPTSHTVGDTPVFRVTAFARRTGSTFDIMVQSTTRY